MNRLGYGYLNEHYQLGLPKLKVECWMEDGVDSIVNYGASKRKIIAKTAKLAAMVDCPYQQMIFVSLELLRR